MIRRNDSDKAIQITQFQEHQMVVFVSEGLEGFKWTAPTTRTTGNLLTNPIWIALNAYLRGLHG